MRKANAGRLRLVREDSRPIALATGGLLTPSLEVGLCHDGGDADTGSGVEVGRQTALRHGVESEH